MKRLRAAFLTVCLVVLAAALAFVVWALNAHGPESAAYSTALADPSVVVARRDGFITIRPRSSYPKVGLLFYPGARVAPEAYVAKLAAISAAGCPRRVESIFLKNKRPDTGWLASTSLWRAAAASAERPRLAVS